MAVFKLVVVAKREKMNILVRRERERVREKNRGSEVLVRLLSGSLFSLDSTMLIRSRGGKKENTKDQSVVNIDRDSNFSAVDRWCQ